jgi:predicted signal transduction protein with EAL and GGDEF domain
MSATTSEQLTTGGRRDSAPRLLVVGRDLSSYAGAVAILGQSGFRLTTASAPGDARAAFARSRPDVVIVDLTSLGAEGYDLCASLGTAPGARTPILVIAAEGDANSIALAFRAGATDFFVKPLDHALLAHRLSFLLRTCAEWSDGGRERHALKLAHLDSLTRLPNRAFLRRFLEYTIADARRHSERVAVLALDLDGFKRVNDVLGHAAGDELLCMVAERVSGSVRASDSVAALASLDGIGVQGPVAARLGGDEFVAVLTHLQAPEDAAIVAKRIADRLAVGFQIRGTEVFVSSSIGIATFPENAEDVDTLLGHADAAMYQAKEGGRNRFHFYTESMQKAARARIELENRLRSALARGRITDARSSFVDDGECEFHLVYQPKIALPGGRVTGVEALVRWDSSRGAVSPAQFIPLAESTGLIVPMGAWILRTACIQAAAWAATIGRPLPVAVNVSSRQLRERSFADLVTHTLAATGLDPALLELEITEGVVMDDTSVSHDLLTGLRGLGIRLALDDFGTGYSSLSYLTRLPIDSLKIDRSFVQRSVLHREAAKITSAIISLAQSLGINVVVEGVESSEQVQALSYVGQLEMQGFLFAKPMTPAELEQWLKGR